MTDELFDAWQRLPAGKGLHVVEGGPGEASALLALCAEHHRLDAEMNRSPGGVKATDVAASDALAARIRDMAPTTLVEAAAKARVWAADNEGDEGDKWLERLASDLEWLAEGKAAWHDIAGPGRQLVQRVLEWRCDPPVIRPGALLSRRHPNHPRTAGRRLRSILTRVSRRRR